MPFGVSIWELMILLLVLLLVFGAKRLPEMGRSLGKGMREFKEGVSGIEQSADTPTPTPTATQELPAGSSQPAVPASGTETERETVH
jgi:sec-independent protein translocase protein TatA